MGVCEDTVHLLTGQERLKDEYKDQNVLTKVNKADMAEMMESIKEYLRSCCAVVTVPLACMIREIIIVQIYGDYPEYGTPDNKMITRMLCLHPDKNRLNNEQSAQLIREHMAEYKIDNRSVYSNLDKIFKDTDLYPYVKQHKFKRDGRGI